MRGRFIALEGLDGAGTTTAARGLRGALERRGVPVLGTFQPSDRPIGVAIRGHLRADAAAEIDARALALLFAADRLDHVAATIEPALAAGHWVVCDRYVMSSWVYQADSCDPAWVRRINDQAPWPDLSCVLSISPAGAHARVRRRADDDATPTDIYDALAVQRRVAARYEACVTEGLPGVVGIDATLAPAAVVEAIVRACADAGLL